MKSEYFFCPHCRTKLQKSAAAFVMGEAKNAIVMGGMASSVTCPACGGAIDSQAMIAGKYDPPKASWVETLIFFLWIGATIFLMVQFDFGFWSAIGIATGGIVLLALLERFWKKT